MYLTVRDEDKADIVELAGTSSISGTNCTPHPGRPTASVAQAPVTTAYRRRTQHPDALDIMREGRVQFIVNIPTVAGAVRDGNMMRRLAVELNIPFVTTLRGAVMEAAAMAVLASDPRPRRLKCTTEPRAVLVVMLINREQHRRSWPACFVRRASRSCPLQQRTAWPAVMI